MISPPTPDSPICELADFFELLAIKDGRASKTDVERYLTIACDNDRNIGCDDNDDRTADELDEALIELDRRRRACNGGYPFDLGSIGTVLTRHDWSAIESNHQKISYIYLLFSTRLNMNSERTHADIDGTKLLEEIAECVLHSYLGARSKQMNFGTSVGGGFSAKIDHLCQEIGEGGGHKRPTGAARRTQDGKLDTVGWIPFSDGMEGKLAVFGQCKTGTNWQDTVFQLQPNAFIKKFMRSAFHVDPIRAFFVSESVDRSKWHDTTIDAGILFDRCRIVDFCPQLPFPTLTRVCTWTNAARPAAVV